MAQDIELFYDVGSPYSYLAETQTEDIERRTGRTVRYRPFLLGGVFKASGNVAPANVPNKARWMLADLDAWARFYGVPFRMSSHWPLATLPTQRVLVACERLHGQQPLRALSRALFHAYWVDDRDVTTPETLASVIGATGLDPTALAAAATEQATKDLLRETTDEAVRRGAFGSPSFFAGDQLFFGNDRITLLCDAVVRAEAAERGR